MAQNKLRDLLLQVPLFLVDLIEQVKGIDKNMP
jgi:hypothetical protein